MADDDLEWAARFTKLGLRGGEAPTTAAPTTAVLDIDRRAMALISLLCDLLRSAEPHIDNGTYVGALIPPETFKRVLAEIERIAGDE